MKSGAALIVVDMQEYFCREDSNFSRGFAKVLAEEASWYADRLSGTVIPTIASLLEAARAANDFVLVTEFGSRQADGSDLPLWARRHNAALGPAVGGPLYLPLDDPQSRVIGELRPARDELVVQKSSSGPLAGTDIAKVLRDHGVTRIATTGVATNVCVLGMARELADCDFDVCVVRDACATLGRQAHDATLTFAVPPFASVLDADQVREWLSDRPSRS